MHFQEQNILFGLHSLVMCCSQLAFTSQFGPEGFLFRLTINACLHCGTPFLFLKSITRFLRTIDQEVIKNAEYYFSREGCIAGLPVSLCGNSYFKVMIICHSAQAFIICLQARYGFHCSLLHLSLSPRGY